MRHLDEGQRAMVAAKALPMLREEAKKRQAATQIKAGEPPVSADLRGPTGGAGKSTEHAASMLNVSPRSVDNAAKVLDKAAPELVAAVERGDVAVRGGYRFGMKRFTYRSPTRTAAIVSP